MAGEVRLFEHAEFEQAMVRAAEHFDVSEQFIEKDYYVTEILRIVEQQLPGRVMFKGGTSLSKGWGLINRFSEDIDLFVDPQKFEPRPGKNRMDRILKQLAEAVSEHPALTWLRDEGSTIGGLGREDHFGYDTKFDVLPGVSSTVRLEPGVQSGTFPSGLSFAASPALFPDAELRAKLVDDYDMQCRLLFSNSDYPSFEEVLARFEEIRELL